MPRHIPGQTRPFPVSGVIFEHDATVALSDGLGMRVNIFRPEQAGRFPVVVTHGVYGKDVDWQSAPPYKAAWSTLLRKLPELKANSTLAFMRWEMPDPERWVPHGYAVIQADARGSGKTPGRLDPLSPRGIQDYKELIEWAASQPWSNGRVGLMGISYYAITQWQVAALKPKGLAAIMPWEGAVDHYRDMATHGGIPSRFFINAWYNRQVAVNAHGNQHSPLRDAITGGPASGVASDSNTFPSSKVDMVAAFSAHPFEDAFHRERTPDLDAIETPLLSVGNWGGAGLHLRGNIEGFLGARSQRKWLRIHSGDHFSPFYQEEALKMQRRFLDFFLRDIDNGWDKEPQIALVVRDPRHPYQSRAEDQWPLRGTQWTILYLDGQRRALTATKPSEAKIISYGVTSAGATFVMDAREHGSEITGPIRAKLWVRPSRRDMDLFVVLRLFDPAGKEVTFEGANTPAVPIANGWLRLSHRELDAKRTQPWRPYHLHSEPSPVEPDQDYAVDIEIWPSSVVIPAGYRLALTVLGRDFILPGWRGLIGKLLARLYRTFPLISALFMPGSAPFLHDGRDRDLFGGQHRILCGGPYDSQVILPVIPAYRG
jgi:putative CocE/NonD family hydrolase